MLIHATVMLTSRATEDQSVILTKSLEYHVPTIDNIEKSAKNAVENKKPAEEVGRVRGPRLRSEQLRTHVSAVIDFCISRLRVIV